MPDYKWYMGIGETVTQFNLMFYVNDSHLFVWCC
jgi:hypothetical protein